MAAFAATVRFLATAVRQPDACDSGVQAGIGSGMNATESKAEHGRGRYTQRDFVQLLQGDRLNAISSFPSSLSNQFHHAIRSVSRI